MLIEAILIRNVFISYEEINGADCCGKLRVIRKLFVIFSESRLNVRSSAGASGCGSTYAPSGRRRGISISRPLRITCCGTRSAVMLLFKLRNEIVRNAEAWPDDQPVVRRRHVKTRGPLGRSAADRDDVDGVSARRCAAGAGDGRGCGEPAVDRDRRVWGRAGRNDVRAGVCVGGVSGGGVDRAKRPAGGGDEATIVRPRWSGSELCRIER